MHFVSLVLFVFINLFYFIECDLVIANFTTISENDQELLLWKEHSDTIMREGKSKSSLVLQKTKQFQRAVLFTLLNPQSCGAALAGIRKFTDLDLSNYNSVEMKLRGQGQFNGYEFIFRHRQTKFNSPNYVHFFEAPKDFETVSLNLKDFKPYLQGKLVPNAENLDLSQIGSVGILAYGGAHFSKKQAGVASLEIDWISIK